MTNEEAIKVMQTVMELPKTFQVNGGDLRDAAALAIEALEEKRPHGEWLFSRCDKCGAYHNGMYRNFCPNCGADMREGVTT